MENSIEQKRDTFSYEYKTVEASQINAPETLDYYEALGWQLVGRSEGLSGVVSLSFRRNRKIKNKDRLSRLQLRLDDALNSIKFMEKKKTSSALAAAIILGIIGSLMFGGGLSLFLVEFTRVLWHYIIGAILGVLGIGQCLLGYIAYNKIRDKKTKEMDIEIEKKRDEIASICEDAMSLLA